MNWGALSGVFLLATVKFMFAPFTGANLDLSFVEIMLASFAGAAISATCFYFLSDYFIRRNREKQRKIVKLKIDELSRSKRAAISRKYFFNRLIVKIKWKIGQFGICLLAPLFLSIPIGTIICAKFYNHKKNTYPLVLFCLGLNSFALSALALWIF